MTPIYWCLCPHCWFQIKEYYLAIDWLLIITFDVVRSQVCEFQVHYLGKRDFFDNLTHVFFWTKNELVFKNPLKRSVLKSQFQNPQSMDEKNWFFSRFTQNHFQIHDGTKNRLKTHFTGIITGTGTTEILKWYESIKWYTVHNHCYFLAII